MNKSVFTVGFMVIISIVFISALAIVNKISVPQIQKNAEIQELKSVLYAFEMLPDQVQEDKIGPTVTTSELPWKEDRLRERSESEIRKIRLPVSGEQKKMLRESFLTVQDSVNVRVRLGASGQILSYGFPIKGKGLWGTITAFAVISADLHSMIGIDFTEQVETPGLGARITEQEFKSFFRNLDLSRFLDLNPSPVCITMVRNKPVSNRDKKTYELQAITGATQTCDGVLKMLNTDLMFYIQLLKSQQSDINHKMVE